MTDDPTRMPEPLSFPSGTPTSPLAEPSEKATTGFTEGAGDGESLPDHGDVQGADAADDADSVDAADGEPNQPQGAQPKEPSAPAGNAVYDPAEQTRRRDMPADGQQGEPGRGSLPPNQANRSSDAATPR